jgi:hypothetical protein
MATSGNLMDFSLPEILKFLDSGKKTGLLHLQYLHKNTERFKHKYHYIWFNNGRIIAASERSDQQGLMRMISKRGWVSPSEIYDMTKTSPCFINEPMGLCLKSQGLLQSEQLQLLFNSQILRPISFLFQVTDGVFKFEQTPFLPLGEMTGLSMSGVDVVLACLRSLKEWKFLEDKLPDPYSVLSSVGDKKPRLFLNTQELAVCNFLDSQISLKEIAHQLNMSLKTVQQIAFRLIVIGLAAENFLTADSASFGHCELINMSKLIQQIPDRTQKTTISQSFLKNLVSFLRTKAS